MGLLDMLEAALDAKDASDDADARSLAKRIAKENEEWCETEIVAILDDNALQVDTEEKLKTRLRKFAEDCFHRGVKTVTRLNLIAE